MGLGEGGSRGRRGARGGPGPAPGATGATGMGHPLPGQRPGTPGGTEGPPASFLQSLTPLPFRCCGGERSWSPPLPPPTPPARLSPSPGTTGAVPGCANELREERKPAAAGRRRHRSRCLAHLPGQPAQRRRGGKKKKKTAREGASPPPSPPRSAGARPRSAGAGARPGLGRGSPAVPRGSPAML